MKQLEAQTGPTSLSLPVAQLLDVIFPHSQCTRVYVKKDWLSQGLAGALYRVSDSGWMEAAIFLSWFSKLFIPAVSHLLETGPVVLFVDGHHSHITLELIKYARGKGVHLFCLPPNCTHILQPLDVGTFGPLKSEWQKILQQEYRLQTKATNVERRNFAKLLAKLWQRAFTPEHVQAGFQGTGLYPFNPSAIHAEQLAPSLPLLPLPEDCPGDYITSAASSGRSYNGKWFH